MKRYCFKAATAVCAATADAESEDDDPFGCPSDMESDNAECILEMASESLLCKEWRAQHALRMKGPPPMTSMPQISEFHSGANVQLNQDLVNGSHKIGDGATAPHNSAVIGVRTPGVSSSSLATCTHDTH